LSIMRMSSNWSLLLRLFVPPRELALSDGQKKDAIAVKVHSINTPPTYERHDMKFIFLIGIVS
jgi:hypothetical protein